MNETLVATEEDYELIEFLQKLPEDKLRKLIHTFLAINISDYNVQKFHGSSEHGKDTIAIISENKDPLGKPQILLIQIKSGDISLSDWINRISGQMLAAFCTTEESFPPNTSKDNPRRLILFLNGELKPEAFKAIREWNRTMPVPVEVFDIFEMVRLFRRYYVKTSDIKHLLENSEDS